MTTNLNITSIFASLRLIMSILFLLLQLLTLPACLFLNLKPACHTLKF